MATPATELRQWLTPRRWSEALRALSRAPKHPFDRAHRVDTGGLLYADSLSTGHAHDPHNAGYYATAPSLFHGAIELWRATLPAGFALDDYTLIDIGCGKGRVLMLATAYPFRSIAGIELSPRLARTARKNLRKWMIRRLPQDRGPRGRARFPGVPQVSLLRPGKSAPLIQIIESDVLTTSLPDTPLALFYFNSFERPMMEMWLARLAALARERTAPLDLIYIHPEFDALIRQMPCMRALVEADVPFTAEDAAADDFGVSSDGCAIYRLATREMLSS